MVLYGTMRILMTETKEKKSLLMTSPKMRPLMLAYGLLQQPKDRDKGTYPIIAR